jgi:type II secretory pathway pseudopilin PulG
MKKFLKEKKGGFTLVETLVAISIFTISILGLMSVLAAGVSDTTYAKRKVTAEYLAQEGIEYFRNMRDTFVLYSTDSQTGWTNFVAKASPCAPNGSECGFDNSSAPGPSANIFLCSDPNHTCKLYINNGNYNANSLNITDSGFVRKIWVTATGSPDEIKVSSSVIWAQGSGTYNVIFSEDLFNWVQ